ncbi:MAG: hypothetical protein SCALA701_27110 [Candidatus Scalindua sp.]|nr:MAG: hypothetical protein SCALA701_27110 [Candidatus Scalindua sp.]
MENFPAQWKMRDDEIRKEFPTLTPRQRAGQFLGFEFDPAMGFSGIDALEWYGDREGDLDKKFIIVTFGGSTTVKDNWPKYLIEYAKQSGVTEDIVVLNAGLWGYMTFNEKIYFSSWIMPLLTSLGAKPDLVLTMDGVNDIWYRILGYLEYKNMNAPKWFNQYHGYHQHHDSDMRTIRTLSGSAKQLFANLSKEVFQKSIRVMPYTMKVVQTLIKKRIESADNLVVNNQNEKERSSIKLDSAVEDKIIDGYHNSILDFYAASEARDIQFVAYLQPILLKQYYPYEIPPSFHYPDINYMGISLYRTNRHFSRLACNNIVETDGLYKKAEQMYGKLNDKHTGHFESIIDIFKKDNCQEEVFNNDAIHYKRAGSRVIARNIIKDLINKKVLMTDTREEELLSTNINSNHLINLKNSKYLQTKREVNWFLK